MTSAKYWVRGGGRWREIELDSGRVSGWGVASFVYVSRGKLVKGNKWRVLRALRALAKGDSRSAARDGPRLTLKRTSVEAAPRKRKRLCSHHHHHCCSDVNLCHNPTHSVQEKSDLPELRSPYKLTSNACAQTDVSEITTITTKAELNTRPTKRKHIEISNDDDNTAIKNGGKTKELYINDKDVLIMRSCMEKSILFSDADLLKFDTSDDYKRYIFYKLNPLVHVNRSQKIAEMLKAGSSTTIEDEITLDQFIAKLGLRHIRDVKERKRYRTRNTISKNHNNYESQRSNDENDKENRMFSKQVNNNISLKRKDNKVANPNVGVNKTSNVDKKLNPDSEETVLQKRFRLQNELTSSSSDTNSSNDCFEKPKAKNKQLQTRSILDRNKTNVPSRLRVQNEIVDSTSDDGSTFRNPKESQSKPVLSNVIQNEAKVKKPLFPVDKRKVPVRRLNGREYSTAEDRAIVNWVRAGSRAHKVNGNEIWKQLESTHFDVTGCVRSWHSLRNRYLRYILPQLQTFAPTHAAALRAAASAGEMKTRRRRHSMFSPPKFGAASRRLPATGESHSPSRQLRSNLSNDMLSITTQRSTQSLDRSEKIELRNRTQITPLTNKSLNESKLANTSVNRSLDQSDNRSTRRSLRISMVSDKDRGSMSPVKVVTEETNKPKRRRLYNP